MVSRIIEVLKYNTDWPDLFESERNLLAETLGIVALKIHHIGSTSVIGLAAKPIIDILVEVSDLDKLDNLSSKIESLGYVAKGEFEIKGRRYFQKGGLQRSHQVHAFKIGDQNIRRHIAFRNYLIAHPGVSLKYGELKQSLAISCNNDIKIYVACKDNFIKQHEKIAIAWYGT